MTTSDADAPGPAESPLDAFKERIGFDARIAAADRRRLVVRDWGGLAEELAHLGGFEVATQSAAPAPPAAGPLATRVVLSGAVRQARVSVSLTQTATVDAAAAVFLDEVSSTSLVAIPFGPGPDDLGIVSAVYAIGGPGGSVLAVIQNLCVDVRASDRAVAVALCRVIQAIADRSPAPPREAPP